MSTFRQLDSVLLPDGFSHGVLVEVVIGARVCFDRKAVIDCTSTNGLALSADRIFEHTEHGHHYYGVIYLDLGCTPARLFAVNVVGGGKASLNAFYVWQPDNAESRQAVIDRWVRNQGRP